MLETKEYQSKPRPEDIVKEYTEQGKNVTSIDLVPLKDGGWMAFVFFT